MIRSLKALQGEWKFSEINFDYPDLPQYTMYWLGKDVLALGYPAELEDEIGTFARSLAAATRRR